MLSTFSFQDFISLSLLLIISYVINFYLNYFRRPNKLPGPLPLPLIGNLTSYSNLAAWINDLQSKYGDIGEIWIGGERAIWLGKAEYLEKIYRPSFGNYNNRAAPNKGLDALDLTSKGIVFNDNYKKWNYNRRFFTKAVLTQSFVRRNIKVTQPLFLEMEKYWKDLDQQVGEINILDWAQRFFTEVIVLTTTNKKSDTLNHYHKVLSAPDKYSETETLVYHVRTMIGGVEFFLMTPMFLHVLPGYNSTSKKILHSYNWTKKHYLPNLIKERRSEIEKTPIDQELTPDMLTLMLTFNTPRDKSQGDNQQPLEPMTDEDICENISEAILGGIDSMANVICFIIYYVCHNPKVKQHVIEEIQKVIDLNSDIYLEYLHKLHYCEAVIKEVLRLFPILPVNSRMAEHADEIDGHKFEGSTTLFINTQAIQMDKSYWEEPEKFNPERFLSTNNNKNDDKIQKYAFQLFGGGLRMCPGRNLALAQLKLFMVLLFGRFNVDLIDYSAPLKISFGMTRRCDELKLKLIPRK